MPTTPGSKRGSFSADPDNDESGDPTIREKRKRTFKTRKPWSEEETKDLVERRDRGETFPDLAKRFGVSVAAVTQRYGKIKSTSTQGLSGSIVDVELLPTTDDISNEALATRHNIGGTLEGNAGGSQSAPSQVMNSLATSSLNGQADPHYDTPMTEVSAPEPYTSPYFDQARLCQVCKQPEGSGTNTFMTCSLCSLPYHKQCHDPPVTIMALHNMPWQCNSCAVGPWPSRPLPILTTGSSPTKPVYLEGQQTDQNTSPALDAIQSQTVTSESLTESSKVEGTAKLKQRIAELEKASANLVQRIMDLAHERSEYERTSQAELLESKTKYEEMQKRNQVLEERIAELSREAQHRGGRSTVAGNSVESSTKALENTKAGRNIDPEQRKNGDGLIARFKDELVEIRRRQAVKDEKERLKQEKLEQKRLQREKPSKDPQSRNQ